MYKELLNFCNLDWDENCLHFYNNNRSVKTASKDQVRQKIFNQLEKSLSQIKHSKNNRQFQRRY